MKKEKTISQVKQGIKKRFMKLSEEEKNIIRENKNTPYSMLLKEVLGDELLSGLINTDGRQLLNKGGRVEMASGGIAALKALLNFFAKQKGKKGSDMLKEINPKRLGFLQNMLMKSDKELLDANRQEYLEELSGIIKSDKKLLDKIKQMPEEARDTFFTIANEGGNRGRLSVYKNPDFNIDDAISEIEQMKKNLKFKDVPEKEVKRQMNAIGGRVGYSTGSIVKGVLLTAKTLSELKPEYLKKLSRLEGYLGSINMEGKGGREAAKKTIEKIDNLKQEYKALEKDLSEKQQLDKFDTTDRSKNARGGVAYLMGL